GGGFGSGAGSAAAALATAAAGLGWTSVVLREQAAITTTASSAATSEPVRTTRGELMAKVRGVRRRAHTNPPHTTGCGPALVGRRYEVLAVQHLDRGHLERHVLRLFGDLHGHAARDRLVGVRNVAVRLRDDGGTPRVGLLADAHVQRQRTEHVHAILR